MSTLARYSLVIGLAAMALSFGPLPHAAAQPSPVRPTPVVPGDVKPRVVVESRCTADDKIAVDAFTLTPPSMPGSHPLSGRTVSIVVTVKNVCNGPVAGIPWRVTSTRVTVPAQYPAITQTVASGTVETLPAGASVNVTAEWRAQVGTRNFAAQVDYNHTMEAPAASANNVKYVAGYVVDQGPVGTNWPAWVAGAKESARQGADKWLGEMEVRGQINGPSMTFERGTTLRNANRPYFVKQPMEDAGAPPEVIGAFWDATVEAWTSWTKGYQGPPIPTAFPSFAAFPGPEAPPTPATPPSLLLKMGSSTKDASMSPESVGASIKAAIARVGTVPLTGRGDAAIDDFASWFNGRFVAWKAAAKLTGLVGSGPTSGFAPPVVTIAAVKNGTVKGSLSGSF